MILSESEIDKVFSATKIHANRTHEMYTHYQNHFKNWCEFSCPRAVAGESIYTVTEQKIFDYIKYRVTTGSYRSNPKPLLTKSKSRQPPQQKKKYKVSDYFNSIKPRDRELVSKSTLKTIRHALLDLRQKQEQQGTIGPVNDKKVSSQRISILLSNYQKVFKSKRRAEHTGETYTPTGYRTDEKLKEIGLVYINKNTKISVRNRAMALLSHMGLLRSENVLDLELGHLQYFSYKGKKEEKVFILTVVLDKGKTNQEGKTAKVSILRHKDWECCAIGSLALWLFCYFQMPEKKKKNKEPVNLDFIDPERPWSRAKVFPRQGGDMFKSLSYRGHHKTCIELGKALKKNNPENEGIFKSRITHEFRASGAKSLELKGVSSDGIECLGRWKNSVLNKYYLDNVPYAVMAAHAGYATGQDAVCERALTKVPRYLEKQIFPWVDIQPECSYGATHFLSLLRHLRTILIQDMAAMYRSHPGFFVFRKSDFFASTAFKEFADALPSHLV